MLEQLEDIAARRGTSVSALLEGKLKDLMREENDYEQARREFMKLLDKGFDLGTGGKITWTRDEVYR